MTPWSVLYRPPEHPWQSQTVIRRFSQPDTARLRFNVPLARAILDDPAFSPDPRAHPHFPLTNAASYKAIPSKSPPRISHPLPASPPRIIPPSPHPRMPLPDALPSPFPPSLSSESDSLSSFSQFTSPTLSSATSHSQSPTQSRGFPSPVSPLPLSPSNPVSPVSITQPKVILKPPPRRHSTPSMPKIPLKSNSTNALARDNLKPVALQNTNIPRKGRMRALVRRFTNRHNLDRIDELDETDPSGVSYHHDGPYEAIDNNLAQPSLPQIYSDTAPRGGNIRHSKHREFHPRPSRPGQHQSASRVPSAHDETGLSLNLEPGQILQQNTIYSSHASSIGSVSSQFHPQPNILSIVPGARPNHSRSLSLPNTRTRSPDNSSSLKLPDGFQNRPSSSLHVPRERYFGDNTPDIPSSLPLHHDRDTAPYVPCQIETTVFPPPRYASRFHSSSLPRSPQRTPQPSSNPTSRKTQSTESALPALPPHSPRHKSVHSLDNSYTLDSTITRYSPSIHNTHLEPPRIRHLPKRLVMPAPLQSQPPQLQHKLPPAEAAAWQDGYPDDPALEGAHFTGRPAMYTQNPRLLRKRSSAFPAKTPIPDHVPMSQDDAVLIMGDSPTKTANETEGTKERPRRRRLSKRKNDI